MYFKEAYPMPVIRQLLGYYSFKMSLTLKLNLLYNSGNNVTISLKKKTLFTKKADIYFRCIPVMFWASLARATSTVLKPWMREELLLLLRCWALHRAALTELWRTSKRENSLDSLSMNSRYGSYNKFVKVENIPKVICCMFLPGPGPGRVYQMQVG